MTLDDGDEDVRTKTMVNIEQHWAVEQEAKPPGQEEEQGERGKR